MTSIEQLRNGIGRYIDNEFVPNLPVTKNQRFGISVLIGVMLVKFDTFMHNMANKDMIKMFGIFDDDGNFDVDAVYTVLSQRLGDDGFKFDIPIIGPITLEKADIDSLYKYITE